MLSELLRDDALDEMESEPKEKDDRSLGPDDLEEASEGVWDEVEEIDTLREWERRCR